MWTRRTFLGNSMGAALAAGAPSGKPLNLVFLLTDDQRWDTLGAMGNPVIQTPNIDALAHDGVMFRNNFCSTAICCTSRATILTGLLEPAHGISDFSTPFTPGQQARTYPSLLRKAGYRTGFVGKYGVGAKNPENAFDYSAVFPGQGSYTQHRNGRTLHMTELQQDQCMEFLGGCKKDRPFCLSVSFKAPHVEDADPRQFIPAPAYEKLYANASAAVPETANDLHYRKLPPFLLESEGRVRWKRQFATPEMYQTSVRNYYRLITHVDDVVGGIREELGRLGMLNDTAIVFTGDNGYLLGEHGLSHKWYLYEESVRTPLVVWNPRLPGRLRGKTVDQMTLNADLAPTLLSMAGLTPPADIQGRDLSPLIQRQERGWRKEWFYSHRFKHPKIPRSEGIRTDGFSYIRWIDENPVYEELFDVRRDPLNATNLAGKPQYQRQLEQLRKRWEVWQGQLAAWRPGTRWTDPR